MYVVLFPDEMKTLLEIAELEERSSKVSGWTYVSLSEKKSSYFGHYFLYPCIRTGSRISQGYGL